MRPPGHATHERPTRLSIARLRRLACLGALCLVILTVLGPATERASASTAPSATDVMFVFDTSQSTSSELAEAKEKIQSVVTALSATLPNVAFGVSRVEDVPGWTKAGWEKEPSEAELETNREKAWQLMQPISTDAAASVTAVDALQSGGGGDDPEAYGRALWEADTNPGVGWRSGAHDEIVLIADNIPHDPNLNEGIPQTDWAANPETDDYENPFDTGTETPGKVGIPGTKWQPGTDLQIIPVAKRLAADGKPLEEVQFFSAESGYLPYWEYWAGLSGGRAVEGVGGELDSRLTTLIEDGACAAKCPDPTTALLICSPATAPAPDICTATIADASTTGRSVPTGAVDFASGGGSFPAGAGCTLTPAPAAANTSTCSVSYLPPTAPGAAAVITATYAGDAGHEGSSGKTALPPVGMPDAAEKAEQGVLAAGPSGKGLKLFGLGEFTGSEVELPFECGFACSISSGLYSGPGLGGIASAGPVSFEFAEAAGSKPGKSHRPKLLGSGKARLKVAGRGVLEIKIARRYRSAFSKLKGAVKLTLKLQIRTLAGAVLANETARVTVKRRKRRRRD